MKTNFEFEQETSEMLNQVGPSARKAIESDLIFVQAKNENDWAAAWEFVYGWLHGSAENKTDMRRVIKIIRDNRGK
jgi:hypothetical protein